MQNQVDKKIDDKNSELKQQQTKKFQF